MPQSKNVKEVSYSSPKPTESISLVPENTIHQYVDNEHENEHENSDQEGNINSVGPSENNFFGGLNID